MLLPGGDVWGIILKVIPVVFLFVLLAMLWLLFLKLQKMGVPKYFRQPWNCVDVMVVSLGFSCVGLCFVRHSDLMKLIEDLQTSERNEFLSFHNACLFDRILVYMLSVLLCLSTARLWKTLDVFENFHLFNVTLKSATFLLTTIVAVLAVSLFLFAIFAHIFLSTSALYYSSLFDSLCSVLAATFRYGPQVDYRLFTQLHFTIGYLAYLLYGFIIKIFVLNLIIVTILIYYRNVKYTFGQQTRNENFYNYMKQMMVRNVRKPKPKQRLRAGGDAKPLATIVHHSRSPLIISKRNRKLKVSEEKLQKVKLALMRQLTTDLLRKETSPNRLVCLSAVVINEFENCYAREAHLDSNEYEYFYRGFVGDCDKLILKERVLDMKLVVESEISKLPTLDEETEKLIEEIPREDEFIIKNGVWNSEYDSILEDLFRAEIEEPTTQSQQPKYDFIRSSHDTGGERYKNVGKPRHELDQRSAEHSQIAKRSSGSELKPITRVSKGISRQDLAQKVGEASGTRKPCQQEEAKTKLCCLHVPDFQFVVDSSRVEENTTFCCIELPKLFNKSKSNEYLYSGRVPDRQTVHHQYSLFPEYFRQASANTIRNAEDTQMTEDDLDSGDQGVHLSIEVVDELCRQGFKITVVKETDSQVKVFIKRL